MKKQLMFILAFAGIACIAQAQEYRTDISIRDQVLNGQQPGVKFAPAEPAQKKVDEPRIPAYASKRVGQAIREGKTGLPVSTNVGIATAQKPVAKANGTKLPSEMTAEEIKAVAEAAKQSAKTAAPVIPNQGDVKEPVSDPAKTAVPKEEPKKPVEKQQ